LKYVGLSQPLVARVTKTFYANSANYANLMRILQFAQKNPCLSVSIRG